MSLKIEPIPKDVLHRMYWDEKMTMPEIGERIGVGYETIRNWIKLYDMPKRTLSKSKLGRDIEIPSEDELWRMYWNESMSTPEIAKFVGVSDVTIRRWMKLHDISSRTNSESKMLVDNRGQNHPHWKGGPKKYCYKFNNRLREAVRERDDWTCQNCGKTQEEDIRKLSVHHIHYDAENCYPDLISLCSMCHLSSNGNRDEWEELCMILLEDRGLLDWEPPWAAESN